MLQDTSIHPEAAQALLPSVRKPEIPPQAQETAAAPARARQQAQNRTGDSTTDVLSAK
ncbi:hypothetical protein D3C71_2120380 [compost metagenome]